MKTNTITEHKQLFNPSEWWDTLDRPYSEHCINKMFTLLNQRFKTQIIRTMISQENSIATWVTQCFELIGMCAHWMREMIYELSSMYFFKQNHSSWEDQARISTHNDYSSYIFYVQVDMSCMLKHQQLHESIRYLQYLSIECCPEICDNPFPGQWCGFRAMLIQVVASQIKVFWSQ